MHYKPSFDEFTTLAKQGTLVPVYRQLMSDTLTPVSAFCKIQEGEWAFLFESVIGGERMGRYSFLGADPFLKFRAFDTRVEIEQAGNTETLEHTDPLKLLEEKLAQYRTPPLPGLPRFLGGCVGYAGYDTIRYVERLDNPPEDDRQLPDLCFGFYDRMIVFDHITKTVTVVAHAHIDGNDLQKSYDDACRRVDHLVERLQQGVADIQVTDINPTAKPPKETAEDRCQSNFQPGEYESAVERCLEYIKAGDIFQVVLSQRLQTETRARAFDIYRALRVVNPSPFLFYLRMGSLRLVGSSPEIMVRVEGDIATIRPLAGTRKRGKTEQEDNALAAELIADPKERAEHIMLVDLGRNDIGRVAQYRTVELSDVLTIERYSHVMHLCSTVTGTLRPGTTSFDALRACLPAGTLSGAPKVRAMEIIDELEPHRRGPYGGAVGYVDFGGNMDTCIALRTMVIQGQTVYLQAGAGIVYDSIPEKEMEETLNKARGLLRALELAETQL